MTHFKYEANIQLKQPKSELIDFEIKQVKFLLPTQIECQYIQNGNIEKKYVNAGVDLKEQIIVITDSVDESIANEVKSHFFDFITRSCVVADTFEAGDDVYDQAGRAKQEHDEHYKDNLGEI